MELKKVSPSYSKVWKLLATFVSSLNYSTMKEGKSRKRMRLRILRITFQSTIHDRVLMLTENFCQQSSRESVLSKRNVFLFIRSDASKTNIGRNKSFVVECFTKLLLQCFCETLLQIWILLKCLWDARSKSIQIYEGRWIILTLIYCSEPSFPLNPCSLAGPSKSFYVAKLFTGQKRNDQKMMENILRRFFWPFSYNFPQLHLKADPHFLQGKFTDRVNWKRKSTFFW